MTNLRKLSGLAALLAVPGVVYLAGAGCTTTGGKKPTSTPANTATPAPPTSTPTPVNTPTPTTPPGSGYVIVSAGISGTSFTSTTYVGLLGTSGSITWSTGPALPMSLAWMGAAAGSTGGFLYTATGDSGSTPITDTYVGTIGSGGTVSWATSGTMPGGSSYPSYTRSADGSGTLYMAGGYQDFNFTTIISTSYSGNFGAGSTSGWTAGTALPMTLADGPMVHDGNTLFYIGGQDGASAYSTIYSAPATGASIGSWTSVGSLPAASWGGAGIKAGGRAYVVGGYMGSSTTSTVYSATLTGGTLGSWATTNAMPVAKAYFPYVVVPMSFNGYVYVIGGANSSFTVQSSVYRATFSAGTLGSWTSSSFPIAINDQATAY